MCNHKERLLKNMLEVLKKDGWISKKHFDEFHIGSGIPLANLEDYTKLGFLNSINEEAGEIVLGYRVNSKAWLLAYPNLRTDEISPYYEIKHDNPLLDKDGDPKKYIKPAKIECCVFRPLEVAVSYLFSNLPLIITEGSKKAIKASCEGFPTISIGGVQNWRTKIGKKGIISDLLEIPFENRTVYLIFDSDILEKKQVRNALISFAKYLIETHKGVNVLVPILPKLPNGKCGLDDYFVHGHSKSDFQELLNNAKPFYEVFEYKGILRFPDVLQCNTANLWNGAYETVEEASNERLKAFKQILGS